MNDLTEVLRRVRLAEINREAGDRQALEARHGRVWNTAELAEDFEVLGFLAPYVVVRRKVDCRKGSVEFQNQPCFNFHFQPDRG